jgi:Mor family transcriptional regulator
LKYNLTYSHYDELFSDPVRPLPVNKMTLYQTIIYQALDAIESCVATDSHWQTLSDVINMLTTFKDEGLIEDDGVIENAKMLIYKTYKDSKLFSQDDMKNINSIVNNYINLISDMSERTMIKCHRATEKRIHSILNGKTTINDLII